jgi:hypothetical protein
MSNDSFKDNDKVMTDLLRAQKIIGFFVVLFVLLYLFFGTGLHGDDYGVIGSWSSWQDFFSIDPIKRGMMVFALPSYFSFWWAYFVLGYEHQWVYDIVKCVAHLISFYFVYRFACDYFSRDRAVLASILFVFYPLHDTTMYWYMTAPYVLFPAVILYAHSLIRSDNMLSGVFLLFLGAFSYYFTPPYVFGLAAVFLFERKYKKAAFFALPGALYIAFYFWIKFAFSGIERRIDSHLGIFDLFKQLILQPLSFIEAAIGPSYWFKIYYAIGSLGLLSALIAIGIIVFLFIKSSSFSERPEFPKSLFVGLLAVLLFSFGIYALTGLYHHSAFNLGNRSTVYGSLLIAFLLALLPLNKKTIIFFSLIFILPVFGLSDYWKSWNVHQKGIIENIHTNPSLKALEPESTLLVTGNIYSKLGPFSHIEFFSMPWVVDSSFHDWVKSKNVVALAPYIELDHDSLVDPKFGGRYPLGSKIYVYNSEANTVSPIALAAVPKLLTDRPREIRHWVQLTKGTWIESSIVALSPRLVYLFQ